MSHRAEGVVITESLPERGLVRLVSFALSRDAITTPGEPRFSLNAHDSDREIDTIRNELHPLDSQR